jgi:uroporphyrinogen decarboxylase
MLQVFDSWAGVLSAEQYNEFALKYISQICNAINEVPITVFAKDAHFALKDLGKLNCNTIGLDWTMGINESRILVGPDKTLQGNMDPCLLYADYSTIKEKTLQMLKAFGPNKYIANLGHGLYPDIDKDKVKFFVDTIKEFEYK